MIVDDLEREIYYLGEVCDFLVSRRDSAVLEENFRSALVLDGLIARVESRCDLLREWVIKLTEEEMMRRYGQR